MSFVIANEMRFSARCAEIEDTSPERQRRDGVLDFRTSREEPEISSTLRVGVYDCLYVALAERETCQLVTADDKLVRNLQPHCSFIVALAALP